MKVKIGYLYYDLLNLYGENGNILALKKCLEDLNIEVEIHFMTIGDKFKLEEFDLLYIGAGSEENIKLVLKDFIKYKNDLKKYIDNKKFVLATGNSIDLFGKDIEIKNKKIKCLEIFDYNVKYEDFRLIDEALFECNLINKPFIGFQNQYSVMENNKHSFFNVLKGIGSSPNDSNEGVHYKNFYGTYLIGPLLIRNPHFLEYLIKKIVLAKDPNYKFLKFNLDKEYKAYETYIDNFYKEKQTN